MVEVDNSEATETTLETRGGGDSYTTELVEYIKELHKKLTSKEDQIESLKEDVRNAELWAKTKKPKLSVRPKLLNIKFKIQWEILSLRSLNPPSHLT